MKVTMEEVNRWYKENKSRLDEIFQESYPESTIGEYKAYMRKAYVESTGNTIEGVNDL